MTPTETNTLMALAYAQWPHIQQTTALVDVWYAQLVHTDVRLARSALQELLSVKKFPPTIADLSEFIALEARRANANAGVLAPALDRGPVALADVTCGASAGCGWLADLNRRHSPESWLGLAKDDRIGEHRAHIRSHATQRAQRRGLKLVV